MTQLTTGFEFDSIEDFAIRCPVRGTVWPYSNQFCWYEMRVAERHFEEDNEIPVLLEVEMSQYWFGSERLFLDRAKLWVIVRLTEKIREKFSPQFDDDSGHQQFALIPDFFSSRNLVMNISSPRNDVSIGFYIMTGLNPWLTIDGSIVEQIIPFNISRD